MVNRIAIISDTHLTSCSDRFFRLVELAFQDCTAIIHAGDITDLGVLEAFSGKALYAVHGNMCSHRVKERCPESLRISIDGYAIAVCHGAGVRGSIEEHLYERFSDADCIVYGHTHQPANYHYGTTLMVNPGSFAGTGRFGNPGTYGILETSEDMLRATIHTLPDKP